MDTTYVVFTTKQANYQSFFQYAYSFQTILHFIIFHFIKNSRVTVIRNQDLVFIFFKLVTQSKTFYFSNLTPNLIPQTKIWFFKESS